MGYILLIEDNQQNADLMKHILSTEGYEVRHHMTGMEGVKAAVGEKPRLILIDFSLPDVDGLALILTLRKRLGDTVPLISCTARTGEAEKKMSQSFGAAAFLSKPFTPDELLQVVQHFYPLSGAK